MTDQSTLPGSSPATLSTKAEDAAHANNRRQLERRNEDRRRIEQTTVRSLLALIIAGAAAVLAGIALWLQFSENKNLAAVLEQHGALNTDLGALRQELSAANGRVSANAEQLKALTALSPRVQELEGSVAEVRGRVDAGRRAWTLAETRYLLQVANRGLILERDAGTAIIALDAADTRLKELRDPSLDGVRRSLAAEIQALHLVPQPDLAGIDARLAAAEGLASRLTVVGAIPDRYRPEKTENSSAPGFARAWQLIRSSLTNMISIRRIGKDAVELVSLEEQNVRRQHLQMLLFAARIAALRGDDAVFHKNINTATGWLAEMFDPRDSGVANVNETLRDLSAANIAPPLPDIAGSLRMLDRLAFSAQRESQSEGQNEKIDRSSSESNGDAKSKGKYGGQSDDKGGS